MSNYSKRQSKKTLGIQNLKGVSVANTRVGNKYNVKFRAEAMNEGKAYFNGSYPTATDAAHAANKLFKQFYGSANAAKKAGKWNSIA